MAARRTKGKTVGEKKIVEVGCGIIRRGGKVLIAQRPHGSHLSGYWEFPGGKKHEGETIEDCLRREIFEELGIRVEPSEELCVRYHDYPDRRLRLRFYFCDWISGNPVERNAWISGWSPPKNFTVSFSRPRTGTSSWI